MTAELQTWTPVGRIVQGHPLDPQTKDMNGAPLTDKQGNPKVQYFFALAVPKTDPAINELWQGVQQVATQGFPGGEAQRADFAWKIVDGDDPKHSSKEGFPGCWIIRCSSGFAIKCYTKGGDSQISDPSQLKRGYFGRTHITVRPNGDQRKPSVYINPSVFELIGYGEEISSGPDIATLMQTAPEAQLPTGASEIPVASSPPPATGAPGMPPATGAPGMPPVAGAPGMPPVAGAPGMPPATGAPGNSRAGFSQWPPARSRARNDS